MPERRFESTNAMTAISFENVGLSFGDQTIYKDISFDVAKKEFVCILGPSGCGKSTSLRIIGGLVEPDSGSVEVNGRLPSEQWNEIAFVFQAPRLAPWRTVLSNVLLGVELRFGRRAAKAQADRARQLLNSVGLSDSADKYPLMLSGGERQRVSICRALAVDPSIMLFDEPFSALDPVARRRLRQEIERIWLANDVTVVFVTHDIDEAIALADRIILLSRRPTSVLETIRVNAARPRDIANDPSLRATRSRLQELFNTLEDHPEQAESIS